MFDRTKSGAAAAAYSTGNSNFAAEIQQRLARANNYYLWIYRQFENDMGTDVLEIGCGGGHFTRLLAARPGRLVVADIEQQYLEAIRQEYAARPNFFTTRIDLAAPGWSDAHAAQYDTVVLLNVLEHIKDDELALRQLARVLRPGGKLLLMVPAFEMLYGAMDAADHHFRRYSRANVIRKVGAAQLAIEWLRYMNLPGFFAWFLNGRVLQRRLLPEGQLGFYNRIIPTIMRLERLFPPPFGQSITCVARRHLGSGIPSN